MTVDMLPLDLLMGSAFIVEVDELEGNSIDVFDLARIHFPRETKRLLIKTSNSNFWEDRLTEFERDFVHLTPKTAEWLVKRGIQLLGVDYLSVEAYSERDFRVHHTLLEAGVVILEGLNLSRVPPGPCQLVCLPLKVKGSDGAPARVIVIRN
jgi:arylformamidase